MTVHLGKVEQVVKICDIKTIFAHFRKKRKAEMQDRYFDNVTL